MTPAELSRAAGRLETFFLDLFDGLGRRERREGLGHYVRGLLLDGERKSMDPMARRLVEDPRHVDAMRQRMQEAVNVATWDERDVFERLAKLVAKRLPKIDAWVVDDTGFPKKGYASVGVQRQYSGTLGRIDNCQIATTLHVASQAGGACIGARLYLPKQWVDDGMRRASVGVPAWVEFCPKWLLSLELIDDALATGIPKKVVTADTAYGDVIEFRWGLDQRDMEYIVAVSEKVLVWPPGVMPTPPPPGRKRWTDGKAKPRSVAALAKSLPATAWHTVTWSKGTRGPQTGKFAAVRIRTATRHDKGKPPGKEEWLLCEWTKKGDAPTTFYLSNLPPTTSLKRLVYLAKLRWRIERDYQELKSQLGLDHYEGRKWGGFHHHFALVAAAHAFLTLERALFPPEHQESDTEADPTDATPATSTGADSSPWPLPYLPPPSTTATDEEAANLIK